MFLITKGSISSTDCIDSGTLPIVVSICSLLYHIVVSVSMIWDFVSGDILSFSQVVFSISPYLMKSLSLSSKIIFSAIFFPIHLIDSIVALSSSITAVESFSVQRERIFCATFHHTQDIFMSSENIFFSS